MYNENKKNFTSVACYCGYFISLHVLEVVRHQMMHRSGKEKFALGRIAVIAMDGVMILTDMHEEQMLHLQFMIIKT